MRIPSQATVRSGDWVLQFINIIFLMLLFFLMSASIYAPPPEAILPPVAVGSTAGAAPAGALYVNRSGNLIYRGAPLSAEAFADLRNNPPHEIYVDSRLPAVQLVDIMRELHVAGLPPMPLVTVRTSQ